MDKILAINSNVLTLNPQNFIYIGVDTPKFPILPNCDVNFGEIGMKYNIFRWKNSAASSVKGKSRNTENNYAKSSLFTTLNYKRDMDFHGVIVK